jgi:hypothetical protein
VHGGVVSTFLNPAAVSSLFSGFLANKVGRLREVEIEIAVFEICVPEEASSVRLGKLIAGRAVMGYS